MIHEIDAKSEKLINTISYELVMLETKFNALTENILLKAYPDSFAAEDIQKFRTLLMNEETAFPIKAINYYRINEDFLIYDTDFATDLGADFGNNRYFQENFWPLQPGEVFTDHLIRETATEDIRLYSYIKLEDGSLFELGIKFSGVKEMIETATQRIFDDGPSEIAIYVPYSCEENHLFKTAQESGKPVYNMLSPSSAEFYIGKQSKFGIYHFIVKTTFNYPLYFTAAIIIIFVMYFVLKRLVDQRSNKIAERFSKSIEILDKNLKKFHLTNSPEPPQKITCDIAEINSISNSFLKMRTDIIDSYEALNQLNRELERSFTENQSLLKKVEAFLNFPDYLLYKDSTEKFLVRCFEKMLQLSNTCDYAYAAIIEEDGVYHFLDFKGLDVDMMNRLRLVADHYPRSDHVALFNYKVGQYYNEHSDIPELKAEIDDIQQALAIPVASENNYYGSITLLTKRSSDNLLTEEDYRMATFFSNYLKGYLSLKELANYEDDLQKETIYALIRLLEQHDPYTRGHSESVAGLASDFALHLGFVEQESQELYWAGIVHDMGKILIPNSILNKPAQLTSEEFEVIKKHPVYAWDVLRKNKHMENIANIIKHHHEKYDGSGYPDGLCGNRIPFESRILTLADAWDAMTAERVYKKGISVEEALEEIRMNSGKQFDPILVEKWVNFVQTGLNDRQNKKKP